MLNGWRGISNSNWWWCLWSLIGFLLFTSQRHHCLHCHLHHHRCRHRQHHHITLKLCLFGFSHNPLDLKKNFLFGFCESSNDRHSNTLSQSAWLSLSLSLSLCLSLSLSRSPLNSCLLINRSCCVLCLYSLIYRNGHRMFLSPVTSSKQILFYTHTHIDRYFVFLK